MGEFGIGREGTKRWFVAITDAAIDIGFREGRDRHVAWSIPMGAIVGFQRGAIRGEMISRVRHDDRALLRFPSLARVGPMRLASVTVLFRLPIDPPVDVAERLAWDRTSPVEALTIGSPLFDSVRAMLVRSGIREIDAFDHFAETIGCRRDPNVVALNSTLRRLDARNERRAPYAALVCYLGTWAFGVVLMFVVLGVGAASKYAVERRAFRRAEVARRKLPRTRVDRRRRAGAFAVIAALLAAAPAYNLWDSRNLVNVKDLQPGDCVDSDWLQTRDVRRAECDDASSVVRILAVRHDAIDRQKWDASCRRTFELENRNRYPAPSQRDSDFQIQIDRTTGRVSWKVSSIVDGTALCGAWLAEDSEA